MLKKTRLWQGLAAVMSASLIGTCFIADGLMTNADSLNSYFGIRTSEVVTTEGEEGASIYYESEFGDFTSESLKKLDEATFEQARNEMREGAVLLRNENSALPLKSTERRVTLFGHASYNPLYRTYSAGSHLCEDPEWTVSLKEALEAEGFSVNETLFNAYANDPATRPQDKRGKGGNANNTENPWSFYQDYESSWKADYNDIAIVTIARQGGEGVDMATSEPDDIGSPTEGNISSLALHYNERQMIENVMKAGFGKVIVLINSPYTMGLGWLSEYNVDGALWISTVGSVGFTGVAEILTGKVNPSGQLSDTWAADSLSAPAMANSSGNTPTWANFDEIYNSGIITDGKGLTPWDGAGVVSYVNVQIEGIYVGYKYYETRYADAIMGQGGATSNVGAFVSSGNTWNYSDEVCYPFGFGLSYTTFNQSIDKVSYDSATDTYSVEVKVTNTGDVAGKKAVLVYAQTPYGQYERENLVEKSAIQIVGYEKTDTLKPGDSETVTVTVDRYMLASYDTNNAEGYVLSGGDYYFAVGDSSHEALNNILALRGYTGLIDHDGNAYTAEKNGAKQVRAGLPSSNSEPDTKAYSHSAATGARVTNQFDYADYNHFSKDTGITVTYLTRQNWAGTFPTKAAEVTIKGSEMENLMQGNTYTKAEGAPSVDSFTFGAENGLTAVMMKDVPWEDDVTWDLFLDQFTIEELAMQVKSTPGFYEDETAVIPAIGGGDACDSAGNLPMTVGYGDQAVENTYYPGRGGVVYPSLLAATFHRDIQQRRGELMAEAWMYNNTCFACTGGGNIRRTPFSGRNAEYYSEDSNLNSLIGEIHCGAMMKKGVSGGPKHFATNDQEFQRMACSQFCTEQALREGSLRSFEYALRDDRGGLLYTMTCNMRIGVLWTLQCEEILTNVLRDEWGFKGITVSDCSFKFSPGFTSNRVEALMAGNDMGYANTADFASNAYLEYMQNTDDGNVVAQLRRVVKSKYYMISRTCGINGLSSNMKIVQITPAWEIGVCAAVAGVSLLTAASYVMFILSKYKFNKEVKA